MAKIDYYADATTTIQFMGDPDGPTRFVDSLGLEVPTFIDPRKDLRNPRMKNTKTLDYHVPTHMRRTYGLEDLPEAYADKIVKGNLKGIKANITEDAWVICSGFSKNKEPCTKLAENRSGFCAWHGGGLHPADKVISGYSKVGIPENKRAGLDRVQKFLQGYITAEELTDEEISGQFVYNDRGHPVPTTVLEKRFQDMIAQELLKRMGRFMQQKLPDMIRVISSIAEGDYVEPADKFKAAVWMAERVMGKQPEILAVSTQQSSPVNQILNSIQGGSRDEYRQQKSLEPARYDDDIVDATVVDDSTEIAGLEDSGLFDIGGNSPRTGDGGNLGHDEVREETGIAQQVQKKIDERDLQKAVKRKIKLDKNKRFAMRAQGVATAGDTAWLLDYFWTGTGYRVVLIPPEAQTEARLAKMGLGDPQHYRSDQE